MEDMVAKKSPTIFSESTDCNQFALNDRGNMDKEFRIGDEVWLGDPCYPGVRVGSGRFSGLGGEGTFHTQPITSHYVRVNLEKVQVYANLMVLVVEADMVTLKDALGSSVLWSKEFTFITS
ncbi:hypothetical protein M758_UG343800 [Ceratodon purpureus]|nr:hypothetical protein M758_UG343800 [Ceratodon purpureus]